MKKIVCIGWGSLIWNPQGLSVQGKWFEDGPILPIEFSRISSDNRVTLIIDEAALPFRSLWSIMIPQNINECISSLSQREGTNEKNIHQVTVSEAPKDRIKIMVKEWLITKSLDSAIWTGLSFSDKTKGLRPASHEILTHLNNLRGNERINAEEYIRKAPRQIDTEYRSDIKRRFGWTAY